MNRDGKRERRRRGRKMRPCALNRRGGERERKKTAVKRERERVGDTYSRIHT